MLQAGMQGSPFLFNPATVPWIEHCWWRETLCSLQKYDIQIEGKIETLQKWTAEDGFLMTGFATFYQGWGFHAFLQSVNRVWLYFELVT